jgi:DNA-binding IclR family transcriptional regulator
MFVTTSSGQQVASLDSVSPGGAGQSYGHERVQAVDRALQVLQILAASDEGLSAPEIAAKCGVHRTTVWRLLSTLEAHQLVARANPEQRVQISPYIFAASRPALQELSNTTGQSVNIGLPRARGIYIAAQIDPTTSLRASWVGRSVPLHATAMGQVYLATLSLDQIDRLLTWPLPLYAPNTITKRDVLLHRLERVRRTGMAVGIEEAEPGSFSVSASITHHGRHIGSLSLWGSTASLDRRRVSRLAAALARTASLVSSQLSARQRGRAQLPTAAGEPATVHRVRASSARRGSEIG